MSADPSQFKKLFTVEEANAALPLVRAICSDLATLSRDVIDRRERLSHLQGGSKEDRTDPYREEVAQIEEELDLDTSRLQEYVDELKELGSDGEVIFIEGRGHSIHAPDETLWPDGLMHRIHTEMRAAYDR